MRKIGVGSIHAVADKAYSMIMQHLALMRDGLVSQAHAAEAEQLARDWAAFRDRVIAAEAERPGSTAADFIALKQRTGDFWDKSRRDMPASTAIH